MDVGVQILPCSLDLLHNPRYDNLPPFMVPLTTEGRRNDPKNCASYALEGVETQKYGKSIILNMKTLSNLTEYAKPDVISY